MNIKSIIMNIIYGKPELIETRIAPGKIVVNYFVGAETKRLEVPPYEDVWKRPRQKYSIVRGVYLRLPHVIPTTHVVSYHSNFEDIS